MTDENDQSDTIAEQAPPKGERIAKLLARAGIGSRRAVERMIDAGMVQINGKTVTTPATLVTTTEGIVVDGQPVKPIEPPRIWRYHKPRGLITSYHDPEGRRTVFEALPPEIPRVVAVGRLDYNTEGLLLLTNDGGLARFLELPATGWLRRYRVRAYGRIPAHMIESAKKGMTIGGVTYKDVEIAIEREQGDNTWLEVGIREGKNREVRIVLEHFGLEVNRLIRVSYGPFQLGRLQKGAVELVPPRTLDAQLSKYLKESGQTSGAETTRAERPKAANPKGRAGWAKASPKAPRIKSKPRKDKPAPNTPRTSPAKPRRPRSP